VFDNLSRTDHERDEAAMNDTDGRRFIPALRRAWDALQAEAFSELGKRVISGEELRTYLGKSLGSRSERNRSVRAWNRLSPEAKREALTAAFPGDSYSRTLPADGSRN
jgi:hypothetical protein